MRDARGIESTPSPGDLATTLCSRLVADFAPRRDGRCVIGIGGESGSGKSVTAMGLAAHLTAARLPASVIHQDDYFLLPPRANHERRCLDLRNVGPHEVNLDLLRTHIDAFRAGRDDVTTPQVDYPSDRFLTRRLDFSGIAVLIVEGTYVLTLQGIDVRVFLRATHEETRDRRRARNRDIDAPVVEQVLTIEHALIRAQVRLADVVISSDFVIERSAAP